MNLINPVKLFGTSLTSVQNPASYIGGETGCTIKPHVQNDSLFNFGIAFPDTYQIGMSNQAIKIIYNGLNKQDHVRCERVFCPENDFENLLKKNNTLLYTLETGIPLKNLDMLGFSLGYELGITGVLEILEDGGIPILKENRTPQDPIIIAGGVGATNPEVFSLFFDAVFIGEAEGGMFELINSLGKMKKNGASKNEILQEFKKNPHVWSEDMADGKYGHLQAVRAVYENFSSDEPLQSFLPLPNIKPVQNHGVVEIMRGCPNGCRFCHAGIYYRPQRARPQKMILDYCDKLVNQAGYSQISLTSLSSADYPGISSLLTTLNERYSSRNISFQLPSLKVNSFTLPLLDQLNEVRKSGLTFAVETPEENWQLMLNKEVYAQHLVDLILEAKKCGWNKAKFYFMVGLPLPETEEKTEEKEIVDFMLDLQQKTGIQCNVNVGTFIPKPHTAYQWARQISPEESEKKLKYIRDNLPKNKFKVGTHDTATSFIEGLVSRGDKRAGTIIYNAYMKGARLNAWEENLHRDLHLWEEAFVEAGYDVRKEILRERQKDEKLPWDNVNLGVSKNFFIKEFNKHEQQTLTSKCSKDCDHKCGICNNKVSCNVYKTANNDEKIIQVNDNLNNMQKIFPDVNFNSSILRRKEGNIPTVYRVVFKFTKLNGGQFFSHLSTVELFNRAIQTSSLPVIYSSGFNPLPRLEFASTLSLGIESKDEYGSLVFYDNIEKEHFIKIMNEKLISFIQIEDAFVFPVTNQRRRESLSASLWGSEYHYNFIGNNAEKIPDFFNTPEGKEFLSEDSLCSFKLEGNCLDAVLVFSKDRAFRNAVENFFNRKIFDIISITKIKTFAKPNITGWTPELNAEYAAKTAAQGVEKANQVLKAKVIQPEQNEAGQDKTSYFELYSRIKLINENLIRQRKNPL